jgi:hypothetical protein
MMRDLFQQSRCLVLRADWFIDSDVNAGASQLNANSLAKQVVTIAFEDISCLKSSDAIFVNKNNFS